MAVDFQRAPRKSVFLAAAIEAESLKADVRIRNMSESGALIEGALLPTADASFVLRRGEVEIGGVVAWSTSGRCGMRFNGVAHVDEWIAGRRLSGMTASTGQRRVDAIQSAIRLDQPLGVLDDHGEATSIDHPFDPDGLQGRIGAEIASVHRILVTLADDLSDDPIVLARHGNQLQSIQSASEVLDHLARVLQASDPAAEAKVIPLHALRARLFKLSLF